MSDTGAIAQINQARRFLEQAMSLTDIQAVRNMAEAARQYARAKRLGFETENAAAEVKVRAERKLGEVLAMTEKQKPGDYRKRSAEVTVPVPPSLADLGISKNESSDAQAMAALPAEVFEQVVSETKDAGKPLATKPLVTLGRKRKREQAATAMRRGRSAPRPAAERTSTVNAQNILDAQLRRAFAVWLSGMANLCAVDPARVVEVLTVPAAEHAEASLNRLSLWAERFKSARSEASRPRVVGRGHA